MRRVNVLAFLCLCTAAFCRGFDASWDEKIKDDHEISPYSEYQKTLWYRKPRYSGPSGKNYGNLELADDTASRTQDYSQLRSIDPYSSSLGYTKYNRPSRSRDVSYFHSPALPALEDDPYGNLNSFSDRALREMNRYSSMGPSSTGSNDRKLHDENPYPTSDPRISRLYGMDSIQDPYQSKSYEILEEHNVQPQNRERKLYVVPRGDQKWSESYLRDTDVNESSARMENFKADKELENIIKRAIALAKRERLQEVGNNRNFKVDLSDRMKNYEVETDQVPSTRPFRNSDIVFTPEIKHNPYNLPIGLHPLNLPSVNFGKRNINFEELSKIEKRNDDDLNLAEMTRVSKANQERDFTLADDLTFGEIQKREFPEEVFVADDVTEDDEDVIDDLPNVAFGEDFTPVEREIMSIDSKEDFNGKLGEEANDDVLEGDVILEETMEEDEQEGRIARESSGTANDAPLKNDDSKLIENSPIAEVPVKETGELSKKD